MANNVEESPTDITKRVRKHKQYRYREPEENMIGIDYYGKKKRVNYYLSDDAKNELDFFKNCCAEYATGKNPFQYEMVHITLSVFSVMLDHPGIENPNLNNAFRDRKTRCVNADLDDLSNRIKAVILEQLSSFIKLSLSDLMCVALKEICNNLLPLIKESRKAISSKRFDERNPYILILPVLSGGKTKPRLVIDTEGRILQIVLTPLWQHNLKKENTHVQLG